MGRLVILIAVIVIATIALVGFVALLQRWRASDAAGMSNSKRRIRKLEASDARKDRALRDIRLLAQDSERYGDPMWSMVVDKVDAALAEEGIEK